MSTLSSSAVLHRDIRSEKRSYKRDKEHSTKWAHGAHPYPTLRGDLYWESRTGFEEQRPKITKVKPNKISDFPDKSQGNSFNYWRDGSPAGRVSRKQDALVEASSVQPLSKSLFDILPPSSTSLRPRNPSIDAGVHYSFDAATSPRKSVMFGSLVEKAEKEWNSRETDKIVQEYEILDSSGENTWVSKGKRKGGNSQQFVQVLAPDGDDDWETI